MAGERIVWLMGTYLNREMLHIYRVLDAARDMNLVVIARTIKNRSQFPLHHPVVGIPKSPFRWIHRLRKFFRGAERIGISSVEARKLNSLVSEQFPNLIHIVLGTEAARFLPALNGLSDLPIVISFHGADTGDGLSDHEIKMLNSRAKRLLVRSESLAHVLASRGMEASKIRIWRTGVPLPEKVKEHSLKSAHLSILQACRFVKKKGIDITLAACHELKKRGFSFNLTLAGDGPCLSEIKERIIALELMDCVKITGFLNYADLTQLYESHHAFLHPSRDLSSGDREGIPNSLLEAMSHGLVVIATRHSGIPEVVIDGKNGILIDQNNSIMLADAIAGLAKNAVSIKELGDEARKTIQENYTIQKSVETLEEIYRDLLGK